MIQNNQRIIVIIFKDFIYSFWERERQRACVSRGRGREKGRERESLADPALSVELKVGLDSTTRRSWPELKPWGQCLTDWATQVPLIRNSFWFLFFFLRFYYLRKSEWETERERAGAWAGGSCRGRGRSTLPAEQGAWCRTRSQDPGIMTWAKGRCLTK